MGRKVNLIFHAIPSKAVLEGNKQKKKKKGNKAMYP